MNDTCDISVISEVTDIDIERVMMEEDKREDDEVSIVEHARRAFANAMESRRRDSRGKGAFWPWETRSLRDEESISTFHRRPSVINRIKEMISRKSFFLKEDWEQGFFDDEEDEDARGEYTAQRIRDIVEENEGTFYGMVKARAFLLTTAIKFRLHIDRQGQNVSKLFEIGNEARTQFNKYLEEKKEGFRQVLMDDGIKLYKISTKGRMKPIFLSLIHSDSQDFLIYKSSYQRIRYLSLKHITSVEKTRKAPVSVNDSDVRRLRKKLGEQVENLTTLSFQSKRFHVIFRNPKEKDLLIDFLSHYVTTPSNSIVS